MLISTWNVITGEINIRLSEEVELFVDSTVMNESQQQRLYNFSLQHWPGKDISKHQVGMNKK